VALRKPALRRLGPRKAASADSDLDNGSRMGRRERVFIPLSIFSSGLVFAERPARSLTGGLDQNLKVGGLASFWFSRNPA
jgi:hypothetical protein